MKFSILIPGIPSRFVKIQELYHEITNQATGKDVEVLCFIDNKKRSVGLKRDALVQMARGKYLAFVDDDDWVEEIYVDEILKAIEKDSDVIVFNQACTINGGNRFLVKFDINAKNQEAYKKDGKWQNITRKPFHSCIWRSELAKKEHFPDASYGEDWHWAKRVLKYVKTQTKINKTLSLYQFDEKITEAEPIFPEGGLSEA